MVRPGRADHPRNRRRHRHLDAGDGAVRAARRCGRSGGLPARTGSAPQRHRPRRRGQHQNGPRRRRGRTRAHVPHGEPDRRPGVLPRSPGRRHGITNAGYFSSTRSRSSPTACNPAVSSTRPPITADTPNRSPQQETRNRGCGGPRPARRCRYRCNGRSPNMKRKPMTWAVP